MSEILETLNRFKNALPIDGTRLDEECLTQASLYHEVGEFVMSLKGKARVAKDHLEYTRGKVSRDIRSNPGNYGIAKLNNDIVIETYLVNDEYRKALTAYQEAQHLADTGSVLLEAVAHRKSVLRDAVSLYVHEYYTSTNDMTKQRQDCNEVTEDQVKKHRLANAAQRAEDNKEENQENAT
jgi:hypothetical protein